MTALDAPATLDFELSPDLEAHEPPEATGRRRDDVRLLVSPGTAAPVHARFPDLPGYLRPGDLLVVNRSATVAAALDAWRPDGTRLVGPPRHAAPRRHLAGRAPPTGGRRHERAVRRRRRRRGARRRRRRAIAVRDPFGTSDRLVVATSTCRPTSSPSSPVTATHPLPPRARAVAARPLPDGVRRRAGQRRDAECRPAVHRRARHPAGHATGSGVAPVVLHTGVSSLEGHETPYPERYRVPAATADAVNATRRAGDRVVAVGTTVVRALETVADPDGLVTAGERLDRPRPRPRSDRPGPSTAW